MESEIAPALVAASAHQLCSLSDRHFVRSAYLTLLGRPADPTGEQLFTAQLRSGVAKTKILEALRASPEGQSLNVQLPGLGRRLFLARIFALPVLAQFANLSNREYSNSARARSERRFRNDYARLRLESESTAVIVARLAERVERLMLRLNECEAVNRAAGSQKHLSVEDVLRLAE